MLGGRMLYNDPSTITYVADSLYMKYINYNQMYIYIHYPCQDHYESKRAHGAPAAAQARPRGGAARQIERNPTCDIMPRTTCNCYIDKYIPIYLCNECNCLSFAAWNCAARAPGSMPCPCLCTVHVLEAVRVCHFRHLTFY